MATLELVGEEENRKDLTTDGSVESEDNPACNGTTLSGISFLASGLGSGMNIAVLGVALPDLALITSTHIDQTSLIYTARASAGFIGIVIGISLFHRLRSHPHLAFAIVTLAESVFLAAVPWSQNLVIICLTAAAMNVWMFCILLGTYAEALRIYKKRGDMVVQAIRLTFHVGLALAPLIGSPFIRHLPETQEELAEKQMSLEVPVKQLQQETSQYNNSYYTNLTLTESAETNVMYLFPTLALYGLAVSLFHLLLFCSCCKNTPSPSQIFDNHSTESEKKIGESLRYILLVLPQLLFIIIFASMQISFTALLFSYVTIYLHWSTQNGVLLLSIHQLTKVIISAITVVNARFMSPKVLVIMNLVIMTTSIVMFLVFLESGTHMVWIVVIVFAVAAPLWPAVLSWVKDTIPFNTILSGIFISSQCTGELIMPLLLSNLLQLYGKFAYPILLIIAAVLCIILAVIAELMERLFPHWYDIDLERSSLLCNSQKN